MSVTTPDDKREIPCASGGTVPKIGKTRCKRPENCYHTDMTNKGTDMTATTANETFNGWANYETWNASLWIANDEFLYNTARACVTFAEDGESVWSKFQRCMTDGQIGRMLGKTEDGVSWNDPAIDADEIEEMMLDL
ncbi:hypothetical protein Syn7803C60_59 [Synechococcus phage ACG-2014a]|uniref:Uncharacterized protein n=1 Tax=Synechococcus phage ACG-2014a TaxID=1493507 RepID=A0A0E3EWD8_9CAUD|nr:hypothetical protein Syn7803C60_59 [Synechococcus phage ACG-2014a]